MAAVNSVGCQQMATILTKNMLYESYKQQRNEKCKFLGPSQIFFSCRSSKIQMEHLPGPVSASSLNMKLLRFLMTTAVVLDLTADSSSQLNSLKVLYICIYSYHTLVNMVITTYQ